MKPAPGDHETDNRNSFLLLTNLIPFIKNVSSSTYYKNTQFYGNLKKSSLHIYLRTNFRKIDMNVNIMKTHIFNYIKYDLKGKIRLFII